MLQKSTGSSDVLQLAKNWNIRIIHVEGYYDHTLYVMLLYYIDIVKYFSKHPVGTEVSAKSDYHKTLSPGAGGLLIWIPKFKLYIKHAIKTFLLFLFQQLCLFLTPVVRKLKVPFLKCEDVSRYL